MMMVQLKRHKHGAQTKICMHEICPNVQNHTCRPEIIRPVCITSFGEQVAAMFSYAIFI